MFRSLLAAALLVAAPGLVAQSPLTTIFAASASGTAGGAVYFDLTVAVPQLTITQIDLHGAAATGTLDILTATGVPGTRTGNLAGLTAWDGPASYGNPITTLGFGTPVPCVLTTPLVLPAGTYGVALRANGFGHAYTYGNGSNQAYATNELSIVCGEAANTAFQAPFFANRVVNCRIHYTVGGSGILATRANYGVGCVRRDASFYEHFATTPAIDLSHRAFRMLATGTAYVVGPSPAVFVPPSPAATNLGLGDDEATTVALSAALPYPGGSTTALTVCSNGFVGAGPVGLGYQPDPATFLAWPAAAWAVWHDFAPVAANPATGAIWFEEAGGVARITWNAVIGYAGLSPGTTPSTFQLCFHLATGDVDFVFGSLDTVSVSGWAGADGWLVGWSPGGASTDPGSVDLTAAVPAAFALAPADVRPLHLAADTRPFAGTAVPLTATDIGPTAPFGALLLSLQQVAPGASLAGLGMPECFRYQGGEVTLLFLPGSATAVTVPQTMPNFPGVHLYCQAFAYDPAANLTPLGAVASNGVDLRIGDT